MKNARSIAATFLPICLVACSSDAEPPAEEATMQAEGDVLGGSISDAMLPLDSVSSQSPPLAGSDPGRNSANSSNSEPAVEPEAAEPAPEGSPAPDPDQPSVPEG